MATTRLNATVLHVEGTDDGRPLLKTCRAAKISSSRTRSASQTWMSIAEFHTGALTADHELYTAGLAQ